LDFEPRGSNARLTRRTDSIVRASMATPDPAEVGVPERTRQLQAVARHPVHPAVGDEDGSGRGHGCAPDREAQTGDCHAGRHVMRDVVEDRTDTTSRSIASALNC
jgi:hypothetical protein